MDLMSSLFPYDNTDELFQLSSLSQPSTYQQDSFAVAPPVLKKFDIVQDRNRRRKSSVALDEDDPSDDKRRKIIHRDVERQRRQEMSKLYKALRSQLPIEYLKGKRSISDHMHEAVGYIRHLQKRIKEMGKKRDELKRTLHGDSGSASGGSNCLLENVTVETSKVGIRVVVTTTAFGGRLSVSRVLNVLVQEGLTVASCISTRMNERLLHSIEIEVSHGMIINPSELQKKLIDLAT